MLRSKAEKIKEESEELKESEGFVIVETDPSSSESENEKKRDLNAFYTEEKSLKGRAIFSVTNLWTKGVSIPMHPSRNKWDEIIENLYLSVIPSKKDAVKLKAQIKNLGLVISATMAHELNGNQSPSEWEEIGVKHYQLPIADYTAKVSMHNIHQAVLLMQEHISKGETVVVHCKAGRGRSATLVACYLAAHARGEGKELNQDADAAAIRDFIKSKRAQISLHQNNLIIIDSFIWYYTFLMEKTDQKESGPMNLPLFQLVDDEEQLREIDLDELFATKETKEEIANLSSIKELKMYSAKNKVFSKHIDEFLRQISNAKNNQWFSELLEDKGPMKELLEAKSNPVKRQKLVADLKRELNTYILQKYEKESLADEKPRSLRVGYL